MSEYKILTKKIDVKEADGLWKVTEWSTWGCGAETFDWSYSEAEVCYLTDGSAEIICGDENTAIEAGMLVCFPKGLKCVWNVKLPVEKYYKFGLSEKEIKEMFV